MRGSLVMALSKGRTRRFVAESGCDSSLRARFAASGAYERSVMNGSNGRSSAMRGDVGQTSERVRCAAGWRAPSSGDSSVSF